MYSLITESCCIMRVLHIDDLRSFFSPSTTIRIRFRPNTAVHYSVFGRILKTPYSVRPWFVDMAMTHSQHGSLSSSMHTVVDCE